MLLNPPEPAPHTRSLRAIVTQWLLLVTLLLVSSALQAGIFTVTTTADSGPGSLRQAIADAAAQPGADTVDFAPELSGQTIYITPKYGSYAFFVEDADGLTIDASILPRKVSLDMARGAACKCFILSSRCVLALKGLRMVNASNDFLPSETYKYDANGPVISVVNASLTLDHCEISTAWCSALAGWQDAAIEVKDSLFTKIRGDCIELAYAPGATLAASRCQFTQNYRRVGIVKLGSSLTMDSCVINSNNYYSTVYQALLNEGKTTLTGCKLVDNTGVSLIALSYPSETVVKDCEFSGNSGIVLSGTGDISLEKTTIANNAGLAVKCGSWGLWTTFNADHCTFADNARSSYDYGSQISLYAVTGNLNHCTVNTLRGLGVDVGLGKMTLSYCLVSARQALSPPDWNGIHFDIAEQNLLYSNGNPAYTYGDVTESPPIILDPKLLPLGNNGGLVPTMILAGDSPAINAATTSSATQDQRGAPVTGIPDLGATEALFGTPSPSADAALLKCNRFEWAGPEGAQYEVFLGPENGNLTSLGYPKPATVLSLASDLPPGNYTWKVVATFDDGRVFSTTSNFSVGVTNTAISGRGSLQECLAIAARQPGDDIIQFAPLLSGGYLHLVDNALVVDDQSGSVTIDALSLASPLTIKCPLQTFHRLFRIRPGSKAILRGLIMSNATANEGPGYMLTDGGAILNEGDLRLEQCAIFDCYALRGGAVSSRVGSLLSLSQCAIYNNAALNDGGGLYVGGPCSVDATTFYNGNALSGRGGAVYVDASSTASLTHCTIVKNVSSAGAGGVHSLGELRVRYCAITENIKNSALAEDLIREAGTATLEGVNIVRYRSGNFSGTTPIASKAFVGPMQNNGGLTWSTLPEAGSPLIDAAAGSEAKADQRGYLMQGTPDLGAVERHGLNNLQPRSAQTLTSCTSISWDGPPGVSYEVFLGTPPGDTGLPPPPENSWLFSLGHPAPETPTSLALASPLPAGHYVVRVAATYPHGIRPLVTQSAFTVGVTTHADAGEGSLRDWLAQAAKTPGPDTVVWLPELSGKVSSLLTELEINDPDDVIIDASSLPDGFTLVSALNTQHRLLRVAQGSKVQIRGMTFTRGGNDFFVVKGGAILNQGQLNLERCLVNDNRAANGGGIASEASGRLMVRNCTIDRNTAYNVGGGLYLEGDSSIIQSTLCRNLGVVGGGGGIYTLQGSTTNLLHCTIATNTGNGSAGGVHSLGDITATYCVIGGNLKNTAAAGDLIEAVGTVRLAGVNLIQTFAGSLTGPTPISGDPRLAALGDYGGGLPTMPPLADSPAIDRAFQPGPVLETDQRGQPRSVGARADLGAVEFGSGSAITVTTTADELDANAADGTGVSLREAIRDVEAGGVIVFDPAIFGSGGNKLRLVMGPFDPLRECVLDARHLEGGLRIEYTTTISSHPVSQIVALNTPVTLSVEASPSASWLTYEWRKGGKALAGSNSSALTFSAFQADNEGAYDVVISSPPASSRMSLLGVQLIPLSLKSQPASLSLRGSLRIASQPQSALLPLGGSHTLSVALSWTSSTTRYQWRMDDRDINGATSSSYSIPNAALTDAGTYTCVIRDGATTLTTEAAEVGVVDARPQTVMLPVGGKFTTLAVAAGHGLSGAWYRDGRQLPYTSKGFTIALVKPSDAGLYTVVVKGPAGTLENGFNTRLVVTSSTPQIRPEAPPSAAVGVYYTWHIPQQESTIAGSATSFTVTGLPAGMTCDKRTGLISGWPKQIRAGGFPLVIKAANAKGSSVPFNTTLQVTELAEGLTGSFTGWAQRSLFNGYLGTRLDITVTAGGQATGTLCLGDKKMPLVIPQLVMMDPGLLGASLEGITTVENRPLQAELRLHAADNSGQLTLRDAEGTTQVIQLWRKTWNAWLNPAFEFALNYGIRMSIQAADGYILPQGYGYARYQVGLDGSFSLVGRLPDGSAVAQSSFISQSGRMMLFILTDSQRGSLLGELGNSQNLLGLTPETFDWFKPMTPTSKIYSSGFGPVEVVVEGGRIDLAQPAIGQCVMQIANLGPYPNAVLEFSQGGLDSIGGSFTQDLRVGVVKTSALLSPVTVVAPVQNATTCSSFSGQTNSFSGSFALPGTGRKATYFGQTVNINGTMAGSGHFLLPESSATASRRLSGMVVLNRK